MSVLLSKKRYERRTVPEDVEIPGAGKVGEPMQDLYRRGDQSCLGVGYGTVQES